MLVPIKPFVGLRHFLRQTRPHLEREHGALFQVQVARLLRPTARLQHLMVQGDKPIPCAGRLRMHPVFPPQMMWL